MALQAFADGSGDKSHAKALVLAGWIATADAWRAFSCEWKSALQKTPRIECFKMSKWLKHRNHALRDERLRLLYRLIEQHVTMFVSVTVPFEALNRSMEVISPELRPYARIRAYHIAWSSIMGQLYRHQTDLGLHERVDFIFDEEKIEQTDLLSGWDEMTAETPSEWQHLVGAVPRFENDREFPPLQAADLLAWLRRDQFEAMAEGRAQYVLPWKPERKIPGLDAVYDEQMLTTIIRRSFENTQAVLRLHS